MLFLGSMPVKKKAQLNDGPQARTQRRTEILPLMA